MLADDGSQCRTGGVGDSMSKKRKPQKRGEFVPIGPVSVRFVLSVVSVWMLIRHGDCRASSAGFHDHVARGSRLSRRVAGRHHSGSSAPRPDGIGSRRLAGHRRWNQLENIQDSLRMSVAIK